MFVVVVYVSLLSLCLLIPLWIVYLLLLGQLSPKHKRSSKQVNDGMFLLWLTHGSATVNGLPSGPSILHEVAL